MGIGVTLSDDQRDYGCFGHLHQVMLKEGKAAITVASNVLADEKSLFLKKRRNR